MKKTKRMALMFLILAVLVPGGGFLTAHCQVPCGIYDDAARFKMMFEHVSTLEKAMTQIAALSRQDPINYNQIVRWVMTKETHADELSETLSYYFLVQRLTPQTAADGEKYAKYQAQLEQVHRLLVYAMKAKQGTDPDIITKLNDLLGRFQEGYFAKN